MQPRTFVLRLLLGVALSWSVACEQAPPDPEQEREDLPDDSDTSAPPAPFGLGWGDHAQEPVRDVIHECHALSPGDLAILLVHMSDSKDSRVDDLAGVLGVEVDPEAEEFARRRNRERLEELHAERVEQLLGQPLCLEFDLALRPYDFDTKAFPLGKDAHIIARPDPRDNAHARLEDLERMLGSPAPPDMKMPLLLGFEYMPAAIRVPEPDAERFARSLFPAQKEDENEAPEVDEPEDEQVEAPAPEANEELSQEQILDLLERAPDEATSAFLMQRDAPTPRPEREAPSEPTRDRKPETVEEDWRPLAKLLSADWNHRRARAIALVRPSKAVEERMRGVRLGMLALEMRALVLADRGDRVVYVGPPAPSGLVSTEEADMDRNPEILRAVCDGRPRRRVETKLRGGQLVDQVSLQCMSCPEGSSARGDAELLSVHRGPFVHDWARAALVLTRGCGEGAVLVSQNVDESYTTRSWYPGIEGRCTPLMLLDERARLVCASERRSHVAVLDLHTEGQFEREVILELQSDGGACDLVELDEIHRRDEDGDERDDLVLQARLGRDPSGECLEEPAPAELVWRVTDQGLVPTDATRARIEKLDQNTGGQ